MNTLEDTSGRSKNLSGRGDILQFPNRSNLFFHGLHIDPAVNSPYRYASGNGQSISYTFKVDVDTSPGLNWYQSRVHGHSALHMMGGLFGAMVIHTFSAIFYALSYIHIKDYI